MQFPRLHGRNESDAPTRTLKFPTDRSRFGRDAAAEAEATLNRMQKQLDAVTADVFAITADSLPIENYRPAWDDDGPYAA